MVKFAHSITSSSYQTKKIGQLLAKEILKRPLKKRAFVLGLKGDLGGGKTTFLQGLAKGLRIKEKILSPTFIIMKRFKISGEKAKFNNFFHIDCYRIKKTKEILNIGFKKIILEPRNFIAIEWPEKIKDVLPQNSLLIKLEFLGKNKRKITIMSRTLNISGVPPVIK